jgi:mRNA degradation ribonuclease J1/J2
MTAKITFYGGVSEIGGNKILLQTDNGSVLLDFGRRMGEYGKFFSEFLQACYFSFFTDSLSFSILSLLFLKKRRNDVVKSYLSTSSKGTQRSSAASLDA